MVFDSSKIPGEIIDMLVVKTGADEKFKRALVGAWYETMQVMSRPGTVSKSAIAFMAKQAGATVAEFKAQLQTTAMYYRASEAAKFTQSNQLKETMEHVRSFSFDKRLFGQNARSKDFVGIEFDDGSVLGDSKNIKLRFTASYMQAATH